MIIRFTGKISDHFSREEYYTGYKAGDGIIRIYDRSIVFAGLMELFRSAVGRPIIVSSWFRTPAMNKRVNGFSASNHLKGCAMDFNIKGNKSFDKAAFIKYAEIFKEICEDEGLYGEAGLYNGWFHFGIQTYFHGFYHWDSRSGKQIDMPFNELY